MTLATPNQSGSPVQRALRSDARRNVQRVLEAAEEVFAAEGLAVPIDEVAKRAGVGVGTIYRHFPTKEALFEAIVQVRLERLVERAAELSTAADPGDALFSYISELVGVAAEKKDLLDELARAGIDSKQLHAGVKADLERCFETLLQRAQAAGEVRADLSGADFASLVMGACAAVCHRGGPESTRRVVAVICDGLRSPSR
ncbi:MAG: TetR/AcrR family transcriptional regulator [Acidimicrobiales bacterium]